MKRIFSTIILTVAILLGLLPTTVAAEEKGIVIRYGTDGALNITLPSTDNYYTYGTTGADGKSATQTASNVDALPASNWNWAVQKIDTAFNGETYNYTITLNNFNSDTTSWIKDEAGDCVRFSMLNLRVVLKGESTLQTPDDRGTGIISETKSDKLLISGDGILNSTGNVGVSAYADVTINSGTINANGHLSGLHSNSNVIILDGAVTATSHGNGISAYYGGIIGGKGIVISGGTVTVKTIKITNGAFFSLPDFSGYLNGYQWNINENTPTWTASSITKYTNSGHPAYVQIRPDLAVTDSAAYDVPSGTVNTAITSIEMSACVAGGKEPYTFSFEDKPSWLTITQEGVISGTRPAAASSATTATVKVTDNQTPAISKTITINIGAVSVAPPATDDKQLPELWTTIALLAVIGLTSSILLAKRTHKA